MKRLSFHQPAEKAAELEPGFCHRMLEFQIQYPRHVAVLRAGVRRNPVALPSGMSGLLARADVIGAGIYVSQVPLGSPPEKVHACSRVRLLLSTPLC